MTPKTFAETTGRNIESIWRKCRDGSLRATYHLVPGFKRGNWLIDPSEVERFKKKREITPASASNAP